jgi:hypothetical protein
VLGTTTQLEIVPRRTRLLVITTGDNMPLEYKCRDCGEVFNEHQAAFVSAGYDCHYIGDGRYLEEVGEDACPACLSTAFDDKDEDQDEDNT